MASESGFISTVTDSHPSFDQVVLDEGASLNKKKRVPRRILHFSDGILEEYSTDEDELDGADEEEKPIIDPKTLKWFPWIWYYMCKSAVKTFSAADTCGENLAWFFGITSPKYQYAIDEYNRLKDEEEEEKARDERERAAERKRESDRIAALEGGEGISSSSVDLVAAQSANIQLSPSGESVPSVKVVKSAEGDVLKF